MKQLSRQTLQAIQSIIMVSSAVVGAGCGGDPTPTVVAGIDGCASCGMLIDQVNQAAGWIDEGEFTPFCSPGCLLTEHDALRKTAAAAPREVFFADYSSGTFSSAADTAFLLTEHVPTVMNGGVICFGSVAAAEDMRRHDDEIVADWTGFRVRRVEPDIVLETVFSPDGMDPDVVAVNKGDIVLWRSTGHELTEDLSWNVRGYPEVAPQTVAVSGEPVELRFMATRPGAGFPIESLSGDRALGMLKVSGAHTMDEAAQ